MKLTLEEVMRYLDALPAEELGRLADEVLARLGMPPLPVPAPAPVRTFVGAVEPNPDCGVDVVLGGYGANKIAVIQEVRKVLGPDLSLADARKLVESVPVVLCEDLKRARAADIAEALRRAGAEVEVR